MRVFYNLLIFAFKSGADTNLAMEDGRTGLHISAESGNVAVLRQLLENGADPALEDKVGQGVIFKIWIWVCVTSI